MIERTVTVVPEGGLHARPASRLVEIANKLSADVQLGRTGEDDLTLAANMLAVINLGVDHDKPVRLVAEGDDAEAAFDALGDILSTPEAEQ